MDIISYQKAVEALEKAMQALEKANKAEQSVIISKNEPSENKSLWFKVKGDNE